MFSCNLPPALLAEWPGSFTCTVVTRGWNGYRNKSQHRKSTLDKKIIPPFQQGFEPATFQSRVRRSNHWAFPAPTATKGGKRSLIYWGQRPSVISWNIKSLCRFRLSFNVQNPDSMYSFWWLVPRIPPIIDNLIDTFNGAVYLVLIFVFIFLYRFLMVGYTWVFWFFYFFYFYRFLVLSTS